MSLQSKEIFANINTRKQNLFDLPKDRAIVNQDLFSFTRWDTSFASEFCESLDDAQLLTFFFQLKLRLEEIWESLYSHYETLNDFLLSEYGSLDPVEMEGLSLYQSKIKPEIKQVLPNTDDINEVFLSRNFPLLSKEEIVKLQNTTIVIIGASTAAAVAVALVQLGVGRIIISDPDLIDQSNLNRIYGATQDDIGMNKAVFVAHHICKLSPSVKVEAHPYALSTDQMQEIFEASEVNFVVEMIDNLAEKFNVRDVARKNDLTVVMPTNMDEFLIAVERKFDKYFLNNQFSEQEIKNFLNVKDPIEYISNIIQIIGVDNIPKRQMVNFVLMAHGKLGYLAQHGVSASGAAWAGATALQKLILGAKIEENTLQFSVENVFTRKSLKKIDASYFVQLQKMYPEVFGKYRSIDKALQLICRKLFNISYLS